MLAALPVEERRLGEAIEALTEAQAVAVGHLTTPGDRLELCDAENLEILLRQSRARARAAFTPLPIEKLPLFVAQHQGLTDSARTGGDIYRAIETLFGYPIPVALLETDWLPRAAASLHAVHVGRPGERKRPHVVRGGRETGRPEFSRGPRAVRRVRFRPRARPHMVGDRAAPVRRRPGPVSIQHAVGPHEADVRGTGRVPVGVRVGRTRRERLLRGVAQRYRDAVQSRARGRDLAEPAPAVRCVEGPARLSRRLVHACPAGRTRRPRG